MESNNSAIQRWPVENRKLVSINDLKPPVSNPREHPPEQVNQIAGLIDQYGWTMPILVDEDDRIISGEGKWLAAKQLELTEVPIIVAEGWSTAQKRAYAIADNQVALNAEWDMNALFNDLNDLADEGFDLSDLSFDLSGEFGADGTDLLPDFVPLAERYGVVPFSVLDSRKGSWQERKAKWHSIGLQSGQGRGENITYSKTLTTTDGKQLPGSSIFDPVLCELIYSWFSGDGAQVLDPFAGGSVRGVVASLLNRAYTGFDLRTEQVSENQEQWSRIQRSLDDDCPNIDWIVGDSADLDQHLASGRAFDLLFTCPPYFDLEVYSDNEADLSNMKPESFCQVYREIISKSCARLRDDRFACFVVSDVRGSDGGYLGLPSLTIEAFEDAGLQYYNEAILINVAGSLPIRMRKIFEQSRKLGRTHQNVLVFVKGDSRKAAEFCGQPAMVDFSGVETEFSG